MKILHFEYFIAVVEHNSFTRAAEYLHIAQPSLTTAIKKLEQELGYALLTRSTKAIKITEKGILFYQYSKEIVKAYHHTVEKMYDLNESDFPKIKIAILESTNRWVSQVVKNHANQFESQRYQIKEILSVRDSLKALINYDVDIAITNELINNEAINSLPLYTEEYIILGNQNDLADKVVTLDQLPLILPNESFQVRQHLNDYFNRHAIRPNIVMEVDRFDTASNFVHDGLGYAVVPKIYYQSFNANQLTAHKIEPTINRTIYINYHKKRKHSSRVLSLIDRFIQYWNFDAPYET